MFDPATVAFSDGVTTERIDDDRFAGVYPLWWPGERVFGGLVVAQAVASAIETVDHAFQLHSLHGYFLRPAAPGDASTVRVDRVRDGRTFCTRSTSTEVDNKTTFTMTASFQKPEEGERYQLAMGSVESPGHAELLASPDGPFEVIELGATPVQPDGTYASTRRAWMRCAQLEGAPAGLQLAGAAYASDMTRAAFRPSSLNTWGTHTDASLDHAVWFHAVPDLSRWHLFDLHTVVTIGGRSFMRGALYDEHGVVSLSMAQEILIRRLDHGVAVSFDDPSAGSAMS